MTGESRHTLRFGDLDWKGHPSPEGWKMYALAEGATLGNPEPVERELAHQLIDGSVKEVVGHGNRVATFDILIEGADSTVLNRGSAALRRACAMASRSDENRDRPPVFLTWTPPDGFGAVTAFEVVVAHAPWVFDDRDELRTQRRHRVTVECQPFGISPEPMRDVALQVETPAGDQSVNTCDSASGFAGVGGTASLDTSVKYQGTGAIKVTTPPAVPFGEELDWRHTGTVELTGLSLTAPADRPYISFKGSINYYMVNAYWASLQVNGVPATFVSATQINSSWVEFVFRTDVTDTITSLRMSQTISTYLSTPITPRFDDIRRNGAASSLPRQSLRWVPIEGAARTGVTLEISHPTNGLGKVMVLTSSALSSRGFAPNLMKWCTASTTSSTSSVSGRVKSFGNSFVPFEFPAAMLRPGMYQLFGLMQTGDLFSQQNRSAGIVVKMSTKVGSTTLSTAEHKQIIAKTGEGAFDFIDCGQLTLPSTTLSPGAVGTVRLEIACVDYHDYLVEPDHEEGPNTWGSSFQEFFLVPLGAGSTLNIFNCGGTGTAAVKSANSRLTLRSADLLSRFPAALLGTQENGSDAYQALGEAVRWNELSATPGDLMVYVANTGGANASADVTYFKRWPDLAAD